MIEKVTGRKLADVLHERVLRPAGLRHTLFPQDDESPEPHPRGYTDQTLSGEVEDVTDWNPSWAWAAGAMISDLPDLRRWAKVVATRTGGGDRPAARAGRSPLVRIHALRREDPPWEDPRPRPG
ncbi:CubicO group peptidase (beta-lactamase class C family) [Streptomyces sp. AK010]|nr:CubicO group peptidase (beta-lactamase class C family) [Streptomyces sp. AK010]